MGIIPKKTLPRNPRAKKRQIIRALAWITVETERSRQRHAHGVTLSRLQHIAVDAEQRGRFHAKEIEGVSRHQVLEISRLEVAGRPYYVLAISFARNAECNKKSLCTLCANARETP